MNDTYEEGAVDNMLNDVEYNKKVRRRKWILAYIKYVRISVDFLTLSMTMTEFWFRDLTEQERNTKEIVYQVLEHWIRDIYHEDPWQPTIERAIVDDSNDYRKDILPIPLRTDPNAFIAFAKSKDFSYSYRNNKYNNKIPKCFMDNFEAVRAVCVREGTYLSEASPRLKYIDELVRVAFMHGKGFYPYPIKDAPERLKLDKGFILESFKHKLDNWDNYHASDWTEVLSQFDLCDQIFFLDKVPITEIPHVFRYFPNEIRNDKSTILRLLQSVAPSKTADLVGVCSERLQADTEVSEILKQQMMSSGKDNIWYNEGKTKDEIRKAISAKEITSFFNIPELIRDDPTVIRSAIKAGIIYWEDVPKEYLEEKETILALINGESVNDELYSEIPNNLKKDPEIALAFITHISSQQYWKEIFRNFPHFGRSREAVLSVIKYLKSVNDDCDDYNPFLTDYEYFNGGYLRSYDTLKGYLRNFSSDKEMMLSLFENKMSDSYKIVDKRFLNDRDFMEHVSESSSISITLATSEFQVRNLDLVEKAFSNLQKEFIESPEHIFDYTIERFFDGLAPEVLTHRCIVMKFLTCDGVLNSMNECELFRFGSCVSVYMVERFIHDHPKHPFLNDKEIISLLVRYDSKFFPYASNELKDNKEFVLELVKENKMILYHACKGFRYDEEILTATLVKDAGSLIDCFDLLNSSSDAKFLNEYARKIRSKVDRHNIFVQEFLRGISTFVSNGNQSGTYILPPKHRCPLQKLDHGMETSISFKRLIAEFADVPVGQDFINYKAVSIVLQEFGLY